MSDPMAGFGDNVRIRVTPQTEAAGIAGLSGQVYGETTPSVTQVHVIGQLASDFALNVHIKDRNVALWLAPQLVEFVDHAPGTEIRIGSSRHVRRADGEWVKVTPVTDSWFSRLLRRR